MWRIAVSANAQDTMSSLRAKFKALPPEQKGANQSFAIRIHRALSWMERAGKQQDLETRFIYAWIAFNALYGQARKGLPTARSQGLYGGGDRSEYVDFLNKLARLDSQRLMAEATRIRAFLVRLVGYKYLYFCYWRDMPDWPESLQADVGKFGRAMESRRVAHVLSLVFDRLYTMRLQLFHGGATFGSRVNRESVKLAEMIINQVIPPILEVMIDHGLAEDWGEFAYPPRDQPPR